MTERKEGFCGLANHRVSRCARIDTITTIMRFAVALRTKSVIDLVAARGLGFKNAGAFLEELLLLLVKEGLRNLLRLADLR
jgi:hypothetical protein